VGFGNPLTCSSPGHSALRGFNLQKTTNQRGENEWKSRSSEMKKPSAKNHNGGAEYTIKREGAGKEFRVAEKKGSGVRHVEEGRGVGPESGEPSPNSNESPVKKKGGGNYNLKGVAPHFEGKGQLLGRVSRPNSNQNFKGQQRQN